MSKSIANGNSVDLPMDAGKSIKLGWLGGTYSVKIVAGAASLPVALATDSAANAIFGPYANSVILRLSTSAVGRVEYDVATTPEFHPAGLRYVRQSDGVPVVLSGLGTEAAFAVDGGGSSSTATVIMSDPSAASGATAGYAIGNNWLNPDTGKLYQASRVTDGAAVWKPVSAMPKTIVDAVGVATAAAYGVVKLVSAYAGAAFQITRASDSTTLDIGFDANGVADWAAADLFCYGTTGRITTLYDQSGGAFHATQAAATAPTYSPRSLQLIQRGIMFDGFASAKLLTMPVGVALNRANLTAYYVGAPQGSVADSAFYELGTAGARAPFYIRSAYLTAYFAGFKTSTLICHTGPCASVYENFTNAAAGTEISINDSTSVIAGTNASSAITGGVIGNNTLGTVAGVGTMHALVLYASSLTAAQRTTFKQAAYLQFGIAPQLRKGLAFVGDSLRFGGQLGASGDPAPAQLPASIYENYRIYDGGISGKTAAAMLTDIAWFASIKAQCPVAFADVFAGTNEITTSVPAATVNSTQAALITALKAQGYSKVVISTLTARGGAYTSVVAATNVGIRAGLGQDATVDYGADPDVGEGQQANTLYYNADTVHLTSLGQSYLAALSAAKWSTFL